MQRATEPSQNTRPLLCSLCALLTIRPRLEHKFDNGPNFYFEQRADQARFFALYLILFVEYAAL
jgi:hypothetical protein